MSSRRNLTMRRSGGFSGSKDMWSFMLCKSLIDMADLKPSAGVKKSHRACLDFLAKKAGMSTEDLYNKITPIEFLVKIGKGHLLNHYKTHYGKGYKTKIPDSWHRAQTYRDAALKEGKKWGEDGDLYMSPLPVAKTRKASSRKSNK